MTEPQKRIDKYRERLERSGKTLPTKGSKLEKYRKVKRLIKQNGLECYLENEIPTKAEFEADEPSSVVASYTLIQSGLEKEYFHYVAKEIDIELRFFLIGYLKPEEDFPDYEECESCFSLLETYEKRLTNHTSVEMDAILNVFEAGDRYSSYMIHSATFMKAIKELESAFNGNLLEAYRSVVTVLRLERDMVDFPDLAPRLYKAAVSCLKESRIKDSTTIFDHDAIVSKLGAENLPMESSFKGKASDDVTVTPMCDVKHWRAGAVPGFNEKDYVHSISGNSVSTKSINPSKPVPQINMVSPDAPQINQEYSDVPQVNQVNLISSDTEPVSKRQKFNNNNDKGKNYKRKQKRNLVACDNCKWYHPAGKCLMMCDGTYKRPDGKAPCNKVHPESLHIDTAPLSYQYCGELHKLGLMDSGASISLANEKQNLMNCKKSNQYIGVATGKKQKVDLEGEIGIVLGDKVVNLPCLYIEESNTNFNIISIQDLCRVGYLVVESEQGVYLIEQKTTAGEELASFLKNNKQVINLEKKKINGVPITQIKLARTTNSIRKLQKGTLLEYEKGCAENNTIKMIRKYDIQRKGMYISIAVSDLQNSPRSDWIHLNCLLY
ncbi:unnamed protein product [Ambrosiozyma monospora]|uniref:Unnamed protein product n=1 Tax=Ambrosiozyma monospora TaxID=43982 RepID=A0A9W6YLS3_AMBMO|nr:unnamed protein product [Ambrosiozyma monospora]